MAIDWNIEHKEPAIITVIFTLKNLALETYAGNLFVNIAI